MPKYSADYYGNNNGLLNAFSYHAPFGDQIERYQRLRKCGHDLAKEVTGSVPPSREALTALTKIEEAIMWANKGIACNEKKPSNVTIDQGVGTDVDTMLAMLRDAGIDCELISSRPTDIGTEIIEIAPEKYRRHSVIRFGFKDGKLDGIYVG